MTVRTVEHRMEQRFHDKLHFRSGVPVSGVRALRSTNLGNSVAILVKVDCATRACFGPAELRIGTRQIYQESPGNPTGAEYGERDRSPLRLEL